MKRIFITGAKGQLGLELTSQLNKPDEYELYLTDVTASTCGLVKALDITKEEEVRKQINEYIPDIIINCAAMTVVDLCETEQELSYQINAMGPKHLALAADSIGAKLVHISTDYVFDGYKEEPYVEEDETNPLSIYGKTKLMGDNFVLNSSKKSFVLRTAWVYGEGKNFVNTMLRLAGGDNPIRVVADQYGSPTSTAELARVIRYLMDTDSYGVYHATCEGSASWYEFAVTIFGEEGIPVKVQPISADEYPTPAKRPKYSVLDNKNLRERHGYHMKHWLEAYREYRHMKRKQE